MNTDWPTALRRAAEWLNNAGIEWMLLGSAATALRGAAIEPGDIDVSTSTPAGVRAAADVLPSRPQRCPARDPAAWYSSVSEPTLTFGNWTFGRWTVAGVKVELAHIDDPAACDLFLETVGTLVWEQRRIVAWNGISIPVVPFEIQVATMLARQQWERLQAALGTHSQRSMASASERFATTRSTTAAMNCIPN